MSELLARAFAALGPGPTERDLALVAESLRSSGDEDALAILEAGIGCAEFEALAELASVSGSSPFVALDLATAFANPGEAPVSEAP
jgi:hypothetical protein